MDGTTCLAAMTVTSTVTTNTASTSPTSISGITSICNGGTTTLTAVGGTLGTGGSYQWGTGTTVGLNSIDGATSVSYTTPVLSSNTTYWVRRVDPAPCNTVTNGAIVTVTVRDAFTAGEIATAGETICYNGDPTSIANITLASGGDETITYKWQANGVDIASSNSASYDPPAGLTATTTYTRWAKDNTCNIAYSQSTGSRAVNVNANFTAGEIFSTGESICYGATPTTQIGSTTVASGGDNAITYQWQSSTDGSFSSPTTISSNTATYTPSSTLTQDTWYRRQAKDGTCNTGFVNSTNSWKITVNALPTASITSNNSPICSGSDATFTLTGTSGAVVTYTLNGGSTTATATLTSGTATVTITGATTAKTLDLVSITDGTCSQSLSGSSTVTINALPDAPTVSVTQPTCLSANGTVAITSTTADLTFSTNGIDYAAYTGPYTVAAGATYSITAKNASGCASTAVTGTMGSQPTAPAAPTLSVTQPTCSSANGSVSITSSTAGLTFSFNGGSYGSDASPYSVAAGAGYSITAKNASGCVSTPASGTMGAQPAAPTAYAGESAFVASGVGYTIADAVATGASSISWAITAGPGSGSFNGTQNQQNPTFTSDGSGQVTLTMTVVGCSTTVTSTVTLYVIGVDPISWYGSTNNKWTDKTNWIPQLVPTSAYNVKIQVSPKANYPTITADANCNNIEIVEGASLIDMGNYLHVSGKATFNHASVSAGHWHLISSPVVGAVSGMFAGQYLRNYDPASGYKEITTLDVTLNKMEGYALWPVGNANAAPYVSTTGTGFNSGDISKNLYTGSTFGWNLVGNPYPATINWDTTGWTKTNVAGAIYIENGANWASYNGTGVNGGSKYIAPTQGFFVKATPGTTASLGMTPAVQLHKKSAPLLKKSQQAVPNLVRLEVSGNGYKDEAVVRFVSEATNEFDAEWDAYKFFGKVPEAAQLYTLGSIALSINSLPSVDVVPVGLHIGKAASYTIAATEMNDLSNVTLEDVQTGIFTDLSAGSYTFDASTGDFNNRFKLHFSMLSVDDAAKATATIYSYQQTIYINIKDQQKGDIFVYNISGQLVKTIPSARGNNEIKVAVGGNYIVKVVGRDNTSVKKVWIQQ